MRGTSSDSLSSLLSELLVACSHAALTGFESALAAASPPPSAGLAKRTPEPSTKTAPETPSSDALVRALTEGLKQWELGPKQLSGLRQRLTAASALTPNAKKLLEAALVAAPREPEPETAEDEAVDLDELVADLAKRLTGISADLSAVTALWEEMDAEPRATLLDQLRYYAELHAYYAVDRDGRPAPTGSAAPKKGPAKHATRSPTPAKRKAR